MLGGLATKKSSTCDGKMAITTGSPLNFLNQFTTEISYKTCINLYEEERQGLKKCLFPGNIVTFPTISYVFLYVKSKNFPPSCQISHESHYQITLFRTPSPLCNFLLLFAVHLSSTRQWSPCNISYTHPPTHPPTHH